ncbi:MAG: hypothetical protein ACI376_06370 [Candidatus Bruticola sp.]
MNLPEFGSKLNKGCKVFALSLAMLACAACGGGETADGSSNSPVSSEVEVADSTGGEVAAESAAEGSENSSEAGNTEVTDAGVASSGEGTGDGTVVEPTADGNASAAPDKAAEKKPAPIRRKVAVRDPFLNMVVGPAAVTNAKLSKMSAAQRAALQRSQKKAVKNTSDKKAKPAKKVVKVVKPNIMVNGILKGGSGYEAMISDGTQTRLVAVGQRVDKYRILGIDPKTNTVTIGLGKEHKFRYTLEKEQFGDAKK